MSQNAKVDERAVAYFAKLSEVLRKTEITDQRGSVVSLDAGTDRAVELLLSVRSTGGKVMLIGNGGSAAVASHVQNDLCALDVRAMVFDQVPFLTALSNDHGYGCVFERAVQLWGNAGDVLIAVSSSGQSENILRAVRTAVTEQQRTITLSAFRSDNPLRKMGELNFYVPADTYGHAELSHAAVLHLLTDRGKAAARSIATGHPH